MSGYGAALLAGPLEISGSECPKLVVTELLRSGGVIDIEAAADPRRTKEA
jgi:hypothetical protein